MPGRARDLEMQLLSYRTFGRIAMKDCNKTVAFRIISMANIVHHEIEGRDVGYKECLIIKRSLNPEFTKAKEPVSEEFD